VTGARTSTQHVICLAAEWQGGSRWWRFGGFFSGLGGDGERPGVLLGCGDGTMGL